METLELKHLAPYLPYGLKGISKDEYVGIETVKGFCYYDNLKDISITTTFDDIDIEMFKPILIPLSDLKNSDFTDLYIDLCGAYNGVVINDIIDNKRDTSFISYYYTERLLQNHFDIFGLIEKELAIDINTL